MIAGRCNAVGLLNSQRSLGFKFREFDKKIMFKHSTLDLKNLMYHTSEITCYLGAARIRPWLERLEQQSITLHLNSKQVKVGYENVSVIKMFGIQMFGIQIPSVLQLNLHYIFFVISI